MRQDCSNLLSDYRSLVGKHYQSAWISHSNESFPFSAELAMGPDGWIQAPPSLIAESDCQPRDSVEIPVQHLIYSTVHHDAPSDERVSIIQRESNFDVAKPVNTPHY